LLIFVQFTYEASNTKIKKRIKLCAVRTTEIEVDEFLYFLRRINLQAVKISFEIVQFVGSVSSARIWWCGNTARMLGK
jgi:hypothetical protein